MAKRVLLKLSGESFADSDTNFGISPDILTNIADQISKANAEGIEIAVDELSSGSSSTVTSEPSL